MNQFKAHRIATRVANFSVAEAHFRRYADDGRPALDTAVTTFAGELEGAATDLAEAGLRGASEEARRILKNVQRGMHPSALEADARTIGHRIIKELSSRRFLRVRNACSSYVDNDELFGPVVAKRFRSAKSDIREAGNCLAADCNSAAVFHLMRVSEHGLRAVAKRLRVRLNHKGGNHPVEYADWNKVITGIRNKLTELRSKSPGKRKEKALMFYSDIADQSEYIKDIWRNRISHARHSYDADEAMRVKQRVHDFMVRLAAGPV